MRENTYRPAFLSGLPGAVRSEADLHVRAVPAEAEDTAYTLVLKVFLKIQKKPVPEAEGRLSWLRHGKRVRRRPESWAG